MTEPCLLFLGGVGEFFWGMYMSDNLLFNIETRRLDSMYAKEGAIKKLIDSDRTSIQQDEDLGIQLIILKAEIKQLKTSIHNLKE